MNFNEVHVFSSDDWPDFENPPLVRPCVEDLHIWFTKTDAYILVNGWVLWKPGKSITETIHG